MGTRKRENVQHLMASGCATFGGVPSTKVPQLNISRTHGTMVSTNPPPASARAAEPENTFHDELSKSGLQTARDRPTTFSRPVTRDAKFNAPMMKSTVPKPFHFATDERAKAARPRTKPVDQPSDYGFEVMENNLLDITNGNAIQHVEPQTRTHAGQQSQSELFPRRSAQQCEVRWSLAPCCGTTNVLTEFNRSLSTSVGAGAKRPAKRAADEPSPQPMHRRQHKHARPSAVPAASGLVNSAAESNAGRTSLQHDQVKSIQVRHQNEKVQEWMRESERHSQAALGYMEELVTANREKGEANAAKEKALEQVAMLTAKNTALEVAMEEATRTIAEQQTLIEQLQADKQQRRTESTRARGSADFGDDDEWCKQMGISDVDSEEEDERSTQLQPAVTLVPSNQATATLTPRETLAMIRMVLLKRWGDRGARRAFSSLGEQGGNIAKQSFVAALGDLMPDIRTKDRTGVWELLDLESGLKNGALYFDSFSKLFF